MIASPSVNGLSVQHLSEMRGWELGALNRWREPIMTLSSEQWNCKFKSNKMRRSENSRNYSVHCIVFGLLWLLSADKLESLSSILKNQWYGECCTHTVAADFGIFHCLGHVAQLKCCWKQRVIMRNLLSGCGRSLCQSSSIKSAFSFFTFKRIALCLMPGKVQCRFSWMLKSTLKRKLMFFCGECRFFCEWICGTMN